MWAWDDRPDVLAARRMTVWVRRFDTYPLHVPLPPPIVQHCTDEKDAMSDGE